MVIAKKIDRISLEVPGTDRNRTRENAPATATALPRDPFVMKITVATIAGRSARVTTKFFVNRSLQYGAGGYDLVFERLGADEK